MMRWLFGWYLVLVLAFFPLASAGQRLSGFGELIPEWGNIPQSAQILKDPTGGSPTPQVYAFALRPGPCATLVHSDGSTDCTYGSLRSQRLEGKDARQAVEEWTAWWLYLPNDFPLGKQQKGGGMYTFVYYHNHPCPNIALTSDTGNGSMLYLQTNVRNKVGHYPCLPDKRIAIADLKSLRGQWHRFELFTRFSAGDDGKAEVYLDGKRVAAYSGHTLTVQEERLNFFQFGIYLCCTKGSTTITPASAYYAGLSKARTREGLGR